MIQLMVEVSDLDSGDSKILTLPCNLRAELENPYNYVIVSTTPDIFISRNDGIKELNDILDEINSENPGMTEEYLEILLEAAPSGDLFDRELVRKLKENEFMFSDISDVRMAMSTEEIAGYYLATELRVPFEQGITSTVLDAIGEEALADYINWDQIWGQYEFLGFRLVERLRLMDKKIEKYIVHIK